MCGYAHAHARALLAIQDVLKLLTLIIFILQMKRNRLVAGPPMLFCQGGFTVCVLQLIHRTCYRKRSSQMGCLGKEPSGSLALFGKSLNLLVIILGTPLTYMSMLWFQ